MAKGKINIAEIKKKIRMAQRKASITEISRKINRSQGHVSNILAGRRNASQDELNKIYNAIP